VTITGNDSASILFKPSKVASYTLNVIASNETARDSSVTINVNVIAAPQVGVASSNNTVNPVVIDTLTFTGAQTDSLVLLYPDLYKSGEVVILPTSEKNLLKILFTPKEVKTFTFFINVQGKTTDGKNYSGIITVERIVTSEITSIWNQDILTLNVPEGSNINKSITGLLKDTSLSGVTFSSDKGTINQKTWHYPVPWGAAAKDTAIVSAVYNGSVSTLTIVLNITSADSAGPNITLVNPSSRDVKVSTHTVTCNFIIEDTVSGVSKVAFKIGSTILTDTLHSGNHYQCIVKDLVKGEKTTLTVEASDSSMKKNLSSMDVSLTYDSTVLDNEIPKISMKSPLTPVFSVSSAETTIQIKCTDESGVASVTAKKGNTLLPVQQADSIYSVVVSGLTAGKTDTIFIEATDSSAAANKAPFYIYVTYDPTMGDKVLPTITRISTLPVNMIVKDSIISITDSLYDANGIDSVYWTLNGKNKRMLTVLTPTITGGTFSLTDTLRRFHLDTLDGYAVDKSTARNIGSQKIIVDFNVPPVALDTVVSTPLNSKMSILMRAVSVDGDSLTWSTLGDAPHGTVTLSAATVTYTPANDWAGTDSFLVKVSDNVWSDTAKIKVMTIDNRVAPKNVVIVVTPASDTVVIGHALSMSVTMNSDVYPTPKYQWFKDNAPLDTTAELNITSAALTDGGSYKVKVTNSAGPASSSEVKIVVLPTYTLSVNRTVSGGTVAVVKDSSAYVSGTSVRLTATPAAGYRFVNWSGDTGSTSNPLNITMRKNLSITANYCKQYTLTLVSSDAAKGSVSSTAGNGAFLVDSGASVEITAAPVSGYKFKQWSSTAQGVVITSTTSATTNITLTKASATVSAAFGCVTFKKKFSFSQYPDMNLRDAVQTADGGYLLVGSNGYNSGSILVRLNQQGDTLWTKVDNSLNDPCSIRKVSAGYLVSGNSLGSAGVNCFAQNGNSLWSFWGGTGSSNYATVAMSTKDNGYIIGGGMDGNYFLMIKTNSLRAVEWDTAYYVYAGGIGDCIQTRDTGYIFVGVGSGGLGPIAIKTNSAGDSLWSLNFSSTSRYSTAEFTSVDTTSDGGYIIAGNGNQNGQSRGFIRKVSSNGIIGSDGTIDLADASECNSVRRLNNGDYMIAGGTLSAGTEGGKDVYVARVSSSGSVLHQSTYGATTDEKARSLQLTSDGGAVIIGYPNWIIKTDENGSTD
jgi:hypothetical protein